MLVSRSLPAKLLHMHHSLFFLLVVKIALEQENRVAFVLGEFLLEETFLLLEVFGVLLLQFGALLIQFLLLGLKALLLILEAVFALDDAAAVLGLVIVVILRRIIGVKVALVGVGVVPLRPTPHGIFLSRRPAVALDLRQHADLGRQQIVVLRVLFEFIWNLVPVALFHFEEVILDFFIETVAVFTGAPRPVVIGGALVGDFGAQLLFHHEFWVVPVCQQGIAHLL